MKSSNVVIKDDFEIIKICNVGISLPLDENMAVTDPEACYIGLSLGNPRKLWRRMVVLLLTRQTY